MIYFIQGVNGGSIKIGKTKSSVTKRLQSLQIGSPVKLKIIGVIITNQTDAKELALHNQFKEYRLHGEWFSPHEDLINYIRDHAEVFDPDKHEKKSKPKTKPKKKLGKRYPTRVRIDVKNTKSYGKVYELKVGNCYIGRYCSKQVAKAKAEEFLKDPEFFIGKKG